MSIATALTALADDVSAAKAAITAKGGTAPIGTADMADAIAAIPSGGAGGNYNIESVDDGNGGQILNITDAQGGGGGDIVTPWYTVKTAEVTIGANSVNNPQTAVSYFEGIYGTGNIIAVFLKDQKATYGADELMAIPQALSHTSSYVVNAGVMLYRMRNNAPNAFQSSTGYSCYLYEGAKYAVIYYDTKP